MALEYIIKSGESVCIDGPAAFFTNSRFIMLSSFQENAPTIQLINGDCFPKLLRPSMSITVFLDIDNEISIDVFPSPPPLIQSLLYKSFC